MADNRPHRLPRGRHHLSRDQVEADQRLRIVVGLVEAMAVDGYGATPVAAVLNKAGVSRETFYRLYPDKLAAFLDAFDLAATVLLDRLTDAISGDGTPDARLARGVEAYLDVVASEPGFARVFLIEAYAAGPEAMARRSRVQERIAEEIADLLGASDPDGRFACRMLVAAVSSMIAEPIMRNDADALRSIGPVILRHVRQIEAAGLLANRS